MGKLKNRLSIVAVAIAAWSSALPSHLLFAGEADKCDRVNRAPAPNVDPDADYDRLDGQGPSGKTVQFIEWEGNFEIHVYPKDSLKGLALKLDKPSKDKLVMVVGLRLDDSKTQLIRRAVLGIPIREGFRVYRDPSESEFDKLIVTNNVLAGSLATFKLDSEPKQLYPDGHPALLAAPKLAEQPAKKTREPATQPIESEASGSNEDGAIKPFSF
jgi:hypothetical protein